jgi:hypothetical protein
LINIIIKIQLNQIIFKYIIHSSIIGVIGALSYRSYQKFRFEYLLPNFFTNQQLKQKQKQKTITKN